MRDPSLAYAIVVLATSLTGCSDPSETGDSEMPSAGDGGSPPSTKLSTTGAQKGNSGSPAHAGAGPGSSVSSIGGARSNSSATTGAGAGGNGTISHPASATHAAGATERGSALQASTGTPAGAGGAGGGTSATGGDFTSSTEVVHHPTGGGSNSTSSTEVVHRTEFAPYFYAWGWGNSSYPFSGLVDLKAKANLAHVTLAFVLSNGQCAASTEILDHLADVNDFRALGGRVKASFGGANGTYLENACSDASSLAKAMGDFVAATGITDLDFDVEQAASMDATVNARRAQALKQVQAEKLVTVSFTLAASPRDRWGTPGGISAAGLSVVQAALAAQVRITRVNVMAMDYGSYYSSGKAMGDLAVSALTDAVAQLQVLMPNVSESAAWHLLGVTPMIGENDSAGEIFTLDDARTVMAFAREKQLGLVSFWAINRDQPCPYEDLAVCSKVNRKDFEFSAIFSATE